jgi:hypothetical protein
MQLLQTMQEAESMTRQQIWCVNTVEYRQTFFRKRICQICTLCSLNLVGGNAASLNNVALAFFRIVQRLFTFFKFHQLLGNVNDHITNIS